MADRMQDDKPEPNVTADTINECLAEYTKMMGERAKIDQGLASMLKRYEKQGVNKASIKHAYKMMNKDPDEAKAQHESDTRYLFVVGVLEVADAEWSENAEQTGFAFEPPSPASVSKLAVARAEVDGYNSGKAGAAVGDCPFAPGSEEFVAWRDGWDNAERDKKAAGPEEPKAREKKAEPPADRVH